LRLKIHWVLTFTLTVATLIGFLAGFYVTLYPILDPSTSSYLQYLRLCGVAVAYRGSPNTLLTVMDTLMLLTIAMIVAGLLRALLERISRMAGG